MMKIINGKYILEIFYYDLKSYFKKVLMRRFEMIKSTTAVEIFLVDDNRNLKINDKVVNDF